MSHFVGRFEPVPGDDDVAVAIDVLANDTCAKPPGVDLLVKETRSCPTQSSASSDPAKSHGMGKPDEGILTRTWAFKEPRVKCTWTIPSTAEITRKEYPLWGRSRL